MNTRPFPRLVDATPDTRRAPVERGRLVYDFQIPDAFLGGLPGVRDKVRWVRTHLPRDQRVKVGRASAWYESTILAYIASQTGTAA